MELNKLRPITNSELWNLYTDYTKELLAVRINELVQATDSLYIHRLQGEIKTLKDILTLRERANVR